MKQQLQVPVGMTQTASGQKTNSSPVQRTRSSPAQKTKTLPLQVLEAKTSTILNTTALPEDLGRTFNLNSDCPKEQEPSDKRTGNLWSFLTTNESFLIPYLRKNGLNVHEGLGRRRELLDPSSIEAALLCSPPMTQTELLPNEETSKVRWSFKG